MAGIFNRFEWQIAGRYIRSRRREGVISLIAWASFLGIMIGVATLIIVMAVMNGFRADLLERILESITNSHWKTQIYSLKGSLH